MMFMVWLALGLASSVQAMNCSNPQCNSASAVNPNTCLTHENGTGMSWMDMSEKCILQHGRLLLLPDNDTVLENFYKTSSLIRNLTNTTERVVIGLMMSKAGGSNAFLYDKHILESNSTDCNNPGSSNPCIPSPSHPDQAKCGSIGCCWKNTTRTCSFPSTAPFLEFNTFNMVVTNTVTGRSCVYMEKRNGSFANPELIGRDCFTTSSVKTSFICEFVCSGSFATRPIEILTNTAGSTATYLSGIHVTKGGMNNTTVKGVKNSGSSVRDLNMWLLLIALCSVSL